MLTTDSGLLANTWLALLALGAVAVLVVCLRRLQFGLWTPGRRRRAVQGGAEQLEGGNLGELVERIEQVSQEAGRLVEARCARLEVLIRRAEECLARLDQALLAPTSSSPAEKPLPGATCASMRREHVLAGHAPARGIDAGSDSVIPPRPAARATDSPQQQAGRLDHGPDPRVRRVCELAAAGRSALSIAKELSMPLGEVELVLNIRDFQGSASGSL